MSARFLPSLWFAGLALAACSPTAVAQPALPEGASAADFAAACEGKDGWSDPAPPLRVFANAYHVGTCGIVALLLVSDEGHVLLDTGPEDAAQLVVGNIRALGLDPADVEWIVTSHEHHDHVGAIAELKRLTGAKVAASPLAKGPLESGLLDWRDPQAASLEGFPPVTVDRVMRDGEHLVLGPIDLTLHTTPGHAPGSTTWSWRACEGGTCHDMVYADSVSPVSADEYRYSAQRVYVDAFARSLGKIAALPCDLLVTPHPAASRFHERLSGDAPLADPDACLRYALRGQEGLEARIAREGAQR